MDLGATLCTRHKPLCAFCPLSQECVAQRTGRQHELPAPKPRRLRRQRQVFMPVALCADGSVLLQRRAERGVWGGLWCLPEFDTEAAAHAFLAKEGAKTAARPLPQVFHAFTHFDLVITPLLARCRARAEKKAVATEDSDQLWYNTRAPARVGLPAPIKILLAGLSED